MVEIAFDQAASQLGIGRSLFDRIVKNGKEIPFHRSGRKYVVEKSDLDAYLSLREQRQVILDKEDFF